MLKREKPVIVGVIDYNLEIDHPAIAESLHENPNEVDGDNIDNDNNLCRDDIFGCNFNGVEGYNLHLLYERRSNTAVFYDDRYGCNTDLFGKKFRSVTFQGINSVSRVMSVETNGHATSVVGVIASTELPNIKTVFVEEQHERPGVRALSLRYMANRGASVISVSHSREKPDCNLCPPGPPNLSRDLDFIHCATNLNITLVVSAGNENCDLERCQEFSPAGLPISNMIVVGAAKSNKITDYSNYGGPVRIAAVVPPLVAIPCSSSIWINREACCYTSKSGTSFSTPVVARVFAEIQSQRPDLSLTAEEFTNLVIETGIKPDNYAEKPMIILDPKKLSEKLGIQLTVDDQHCYGIHKYNQFLCSTILHPSYYIPLAILYGLFSGVIFSAVQKSFSSKNSKNLNLFLILGVLIETYVRSLLPFPASIIENMTRAFRIGAVESYNQQTALKGSKGEERRNNIYKEAARAGLWGITKTTLVVGVASAVPFGAQIYNFISGASRRFCSTQSAANVSFFSRVKDSLSAGANNVIDSTPGAEYLTHVSNQSEDNWKKYNRYTYLHWMKYLNDNASFKNLNHAELQSEFENWLKSKTDKYLNENPNINPHDILLPSYDDVLAVETNKLHLQ